MGAMGPFYPSFLQEALNHAERLAGVLDSLDPRSGRQAASTWLLGRPGEVDCLLRALIGDWRSERLSDVETAQAINAYVATLHRGLAIYFGELAPPCCISSLVVTASRASFDSVTAEFPPLLEPGWISSNVTWSEVEDADILAVTRVPSVQP